MRSSKILTEREISNATKTENVDSLAFFFDSFAQVHPNTQEKILKDMGFNIYRQFGTLFMN